MSFTAVTNWINFKVRYNISWERSIAFDEWMFVDKSTLKLFDGYKTIEDKEKTLMKFP